MCSLTDKLAFGVSRPIWGKDVVRVDLHCNFPPWPSIPNAAIGYLKSYLSGVPGLKVSNVYWTLLPIELLTAIADLIEFGSQHGLRSEVVVAHLASFFFVEETAADTLHDPPQTLAATLLPSRDVRMVAAEWQRYVDHVLDSLRFRQTDLAGFTMKMNQWLCNYYVITKLKQRNPRLKTVIGGHPSLIPPSLAFLLPLNNGHPPSISGHFVRPVH